jgi:hypothetical protein
MSSSNRFRRDRNSGKRPSYRGRTGRRTANRPGGHAPRSTPNRRQPGYGRSQPNWLLIAGAIVLVAVLGGTTAWLIKLGVFSSLFKREITLSMEVTEEYGGVIEQDDGFSLHFDPGVSETTTVVVQRLINDDDENSSSVNSDLVGYIYDIQLEQSELSGQAHLTLPYQESDLPGNIDESDLVISYFDELENTWVSLPSYVDVDENTVTGSIDHFSKVSIKGWFTGNKPPTIKEFRFDPLNYSVDCNALENDHQLWLQAHPNSLVLNVTDPDGVDDIVELPEVSLKVGRAFQFFDKKAGSQ